MNGLTTIAALPTGGGCQGALPAEVGKAKPEIVVYWGERRPDGSYGIGITLSDGTRSEVGVARAMPMPPQPVVNVVHNFVGNVATPSQVRRAIAEAVTRRKTYASGGYVGKGATLVGESVPADRHGFEPSDYAERN